MREPSQSGYVISGGAPQSSQMALFWFSRAAGQEDALAFAKLGLMHSRGRECFRTSFRPTCGTTCQQPTEKEGQQRREMPLLDR